MPTHPTQVAGSALPGDPSVADVDSKVCFVVMPFGRDSAEQRWYKGWFESVIKPGVSAAGYKPVLAAAEEQPGAINDEIRAHLAFDPMVVVDLGGVEPEDNPNPNVMYELGIRHAFGLPLVIMAWEGQRLPFDVSNQRAVMEPRDMLSIETNRTRLAAFIKAAAEGKYYRPMEAVARIATIEAASGSLGEESILSALVQEIRQLKGVVSTAAFPKQSKPYHKIQPTVGRALLGNAVRKELYPLFLAEGGSAKRWPDILDTEIGHDIFEAMRKWDSESWRRFIARRAKNFAAEEAAVPPAHFEVVSKTPVASSPLPEELLESVQRELPAQPWPKGAHKVVRSRLGISSSTYDQAVSELVRRGVFKRQVDGELFDGSEPKSDLNAKN